MTDYGSSRRLPVSADDEMINSRFIRFIAVGLGLNVVLFAAYLLLTWRLMGSESAMTITFSLGTLLTFIANRNLTFRYRGHHLGALLRFFTCYAFLYGLNFSALWIFAAVMGFAHQLVQFAMLVVLSVLAFVLQKYWVFPATGDRTAPLAARTG